ncbi:MAG: ADP-ribosylglycohydrolase family protein [Actinobacteria bacterium]|nr:ADP-ribosylglycohydrolase family protein [Actinomycetota bacterium]
MTTRTERGADLELARDRIKGCLLGGAIGDALGAPVEFWSLAEIRERLGPEGVRTFVPAKGMVTDDTQMTLFTAEGLLRASMRGVSYGISSPLVGLRRAYLRWLVTQDEIWPRDVQPVGFRPSDNPWRDGWLIQQPALHARRAPGRTTLAALRAGGQGTLESPSNSSKGCGAVMRSAPIGLVISDPFKTAAEAGVLTHGHPSGYLPAGVLAVMVSKMLHGDTIDVAVDAALSELRRWPGHEETMAALEGARRMAASGRPSPEQLETLGGGWVGHEALAIAVVAALVAEDLEDGLLVAVNHSGDSDSTGAICGNLLGVLHGASALPEQLVVDLAVREIVERVADDLFEVFHVGGNWGHAVGMPDDWKPDEDERFQFFYSRYPGY